MVHASDAWLRLQYVFPTIINIAKILSAHEDYVNARRRKMGCAPGAGGPGTGVDQVINAVDHLADWCYNVLSMRRVRKFLQDYEEIHYATKAPLSLTAGGGPSSGTALTEGPGGATGGSRGGSKERDGGGLKVSDVDVGIGGSKKARNKKGRSKMSIYTSYSTLSLLLQIYYYLSSASYGAPTSLSSRV